MSVFYPATLIFSKLERYNPRPIVDILDNPELVDFFDQASTIQYFKILTKEVYLPTLEFLISQGIKVNLIVTGDFLVTAKTHSPRIITILKKLIKNNQVNLVAGAYWGETTISLYNNKLWSQSLVRTTDTIKDILHAHIVGVYIPQLFRQMGLELIVHELGINNFLCRQQGPKVFTITKKISEIRRFDGQSVFWLSPEDDQICDFYFVSDKLFFQTNTLAFVTNQQQSAQALVMSLGLNTLQETLKPTLNKGIADKDKNARIGENYSLTLYNPLEKAVIRLWGYVTTLLSSKYYNQSEILEDKLVQQVLALQNTGFFYYLDKQNYQLPQPQANFTSPYEAFITMQNNVRQIEIKLQSN